MRRRLGRFLPIVLLALVVQILAPIGACFAASIAASDPLPAAAICYGGADTTGQTDPASGHRAHDGSCSICCVAHGSSPLDSPRATFTVPDRELKRVVWLDPAPDQFGSRAGSHAQARAPPSMS